MAQDEGPLGADPSDEQLVERMRSGDREAAAVYLLRRKAELARWVARNMRNEGAHSREDILSTVMRRFDRLVMRRRFVAGTEEEAKSLLFTMAQRAMISLFRRRRSLAPLDERTLQSRDAVPLPSDEAELARIREMISGLDAPSYELLVLKLSGRDSHGIAQAMGITPEAVRQRWKVLKDRLWGQLRP